MVLKLSDSFEMPVETGDFEWTAIMLNINSGHNDELLDRCRALHDYQSLIDKIREYSMSGMDNAKAVDEAVKYCISNGIMEEYLSSNRAEAMHMILTDYDEELFINGLKEDAKEEGFEEGREQGIEQGMEQGAEQNATSNVHNLMISLKLWMPSVYPEISGK